MNKFRDGFTRRIFKGETLKGFPPELVKKAMIKLTMVEAVVNISELTTPPANRLEKLKGDRLGQWSIRINNRYRVCFEWQNGRSCNIEIVDYH